MKNTISIYDIALSQICHIFRQGRKALQNRQFYMI